MIFDNSVFSEDFDFVLLFGDEVLNEAGFDIINNNDKKAPGTIRIRNKYESSNGEGQRANGDNYSIKVSISPKAKMADLVPVQYNPETGEIYDKAKSNGKDPLAQLGKDRSKIVKYMQNFVNDNLPYLNAYYDENRQDKLSDIKAKIISNSVGKKYNKHFDVREEW